MKQLKYFICFCLLISFAACDLDQIPSDTIPSETVLNSEKGIEQATIGQYYNLMIEQTIRGAGNWQYNFPRAIDLVNLQGDDMMITNSYGDLTSFNQYTPESRLVDGKFNLCLWATFFKNIAVCNKVIKEVEPVNANKKKLVGENHYLRALWYLSLSRIYGKPYTHGRDNLCVPLRINPNSYELQARATVGEVYDQIISDLKEAANLMPTVNLHSRPSKEAAYALLSRVYISMCDPTDSNTENFADSTILYANLAINSGKFILTPTASYFGSATKRLISTPVGTPVNHYFSRAAVESESVFALGITASSVKILDRGKMWLNPLAGGGFGQYNASEYYRNILASDENDLRSNFIEPRYKANPSTGTIPWLDATTGKPTIWQDKGYDQYNVNKFAYWKSNAFTADIVFQRIAEVYLNRAEAYAKKVGFGKTQFTQNALDDVNMIRNRAKAKPINSVAEYTTIYPTNPGNPVDLGQTPQTATLLDVVLNERFLELAWEFNRSVDIFRNKRNMYRNFPGPFTNKAIVLWTNNRIIAPIPLEELNANSKLVQNPN